MRLSKIKPGNIAQYIDSAPEQAQRKLHEMYECIRVVAPGATEGLKWGMPSFSYKRILVTFAGYKNHIGFYPTPSAIKTFEKSLAEYNSGRGSVQFPLDKPLPLALIRKITKFRLKESMDEDKRWKT